MNCPLTVLLISRSTVSDRRKQELRIRFGEIQIETEIIPETLGFQTDRRTQIPGRQAVDAEGVNDPDRSVEILLLLERALQNVLKDMPFLEDIPDILVCPDGHILRESIPVSVVGQNTGRSAGTSISIRRFTSRLTVLSTSRFSTIYSLSKVSSTGVHRKERHVLLETLVHIPAERCKPLQVDTDLRLLLRRLLEETLRDDVGDILTVDPDRLKPFLDTPHRIGHKLEPWVIEEGLLNSGHKPKPAQTARLPDLPHEVEVQHQVGLLRDRR